MLMASTHSIISAVQRKTTDGDEAEERDVAEKTQTPEETARERIEEARRSGATALHLSGLGLTELPDTIGQLTALQTLNLSSNRLTALPDTISQLSALTQLYLSGNQLAALPDTIGQLTAL
ncbi:MAG TPA: leucine-rich repeat domain-containing protein, partial [Armatimonadota bacterium]